MDTLVIILVTINAILVIGIITYTILNIRHERNEYIKKYYVAREFVLNNMPMEKHDELSKIIRELD